MNFSDIPTEQMTALTDFIAAFIQAIIPKGVVIFWGWTIMVSFTWFKCSAFWL